MNSYCSNLWGLCMDMKVKQQEKVWRTLKKSDVTAFLTTIVC